MKTDQKVKCPKCSAELENVFNQKPEAVLFLHQKENPQCAPTREELHTEAIRTYSKYSEALKRADEECPEGQIIASGLDTSYNQSRISDELEKEYWAETE